MQGLYAQQKKLLRNPTSDLKRLHMGITLGFNTMNYRILPTTALLVPFYQDSVQHLEAMPSVGFNLAFITDLRLNDHFNLRVQPGLIFGQRNLHYTMRNMYETAEDGSMLTYDYVMKVSSIYVDIPLLLKYRARRINNYRPYLIAGGSVKYDLETLRTVRSNSGYTIRQVPLDFFYEFGFGVDWYFVYFKFSTEFKFEFGTRNILKPDNVEYTEVIDKLYSRMFVVSFHFE
jgi:hypothetical protein